VKLGEGQKQREPCFCCSDGNKRPHRSSVPPSPSTKPSEDTPILSEGQNKRGKDEVKLAEDQTQDHGTPYSPAYVYSRKIRNSRALPRARTALSGSQIKSSNLPHVKVNKNTDTLNARAAKKRKIDYMVNQPQVVQQKPYVYFDHSRTYVGRLGTTVSRHHHRPNNVNWLSQTRRRREEKRREEKCAGKEAPTRERGASKEWTLTSSVHIEAPID
jgi:hypothetical protein